MKKKERLRAVSLFSCIGVAECYLKDIGIDVVTASDIDKKRCEIHKFLYPSTDVVCGDIRDDEVKKAIISSSKGNIDIVISTPPCQGLSSVGKNRSYDSLEKTKDERNYLILESFKVIDELNPSYVLFENVTRLLKVLIPYEGEWRYVKDILSMRYGSKYEIKINRYNTCDFGIPQTRERIFIRMFKKGLTWEDPEPSKHIITLREAIGDLPSLESGESSCIKNHWARKHPQEQIEWMKHTPTGCTAFDNPVYYPRKKDGERVKGFKNCYKRMEWDKPSLTVTMRNEIMSSQDKVHPGRPMANGLWSDARVLTLRELLIIMSMPPDLDFPKNISDTALRQYIGEGIPSMMVKKIMEGIRC